MEKALPRYIFDSVTQLTPDALRGMGADAIGLDLDNTMVYDSTFRPFHGVRTWLKSIKEAQIPMAIVSNTNRVRAFILSKKFGLPFFALSKKPSSKNLRRAAAYLNTPLDRFAMVGDQLFADVTAANDCGAIPVWVRPVKREVLFSHYFKRIRDREREFCRRHGIEYKELS